MLQADAFWEFACELYAGEGVASVCLDLQDRLGLNVNMILFCYYASANKCQFAAAEFKACSQAIRSGEHALLAHRKLRKAQKGRPGYEAMLEQELNLERAQQQEIISYFNTVLRGRKPCRDDQNDFEVRTSSNNMIAYLSSTELTDEQCHDVLTRLSIAEHITDQ